MRTKSRWLVSASAMAVAAASMAATTSVQSSNTVGFLNHAIDVNVPVDNIGVCFVPVGNENGSFSVTDNALGTSLAAGDSLYQFNANLWDFDIYSYNGTGEGWTASYADGSAETIDGLDIGTSANLFYMGAAESVTLAGQVRAPGTQTLTFTPGENDEYVFPLANPYPVETTFADLETFCSAGDSIYLFNPEVWDFDIYTYNGLGDGWTASYADGTAETISDSTAVILAAGQGASFMPGSECTWTVSFNY